MPCYMTTFWTCVPSMYLTAPFLSSLLHAKVWPVLEPVVCELMRSSIEPLLDDLKPPFIAAMERAQCTTHCPYACQGLDTVGCSQWLQIFAINKPHLTGSFACQAPGQLSRTAQS